MKSKLGCVFEIDLLLKGAYFCHNFVLRVYVFDEFWYPRMLKNLRAFRRIAFIRVSNSRRVLDRRRVQILRRSR